MPRRFLIDGLFDQNHRLLRVHFERPADGAVEEEVNFAVIRVALQGLDSFVMKWPVWI